MRKGTRRGWWSCADRSSESVSAPLRVNALLTPSLRRRRMVNAVAGPRARDLSQGPVGGMLGRLGYGNDEVIKL